MIISIINTTQLHRQEVQNTLRAVNRQLQEDFLRYWHTDAQLRLEGWTGEPLDPNRPFAARRRDYLPSRRRHQQQRLGIPRREPRRCSLRLRVSLAVGQTRSLGA